MKFEKSIVSLPIFFISFIFLIQYFNLMYFNRSEVTSESDLRIEFNLPIEIDSNEKEFIWLTENKNTITVQNTSDQMINAFFRVKLESNPCKISRTVKFLNSSQVGIHGYQKTQVPSIISIPLHLMPYSSNVISISPIFGKTCTVNNGDFRVFVAKLRNWKITF